MFENWGLAITHCAGVVIASQLFSTLMEGTMEYLQPSLTEEMANLEQEVDKELEEISESFKKKTAQAIVREGENKLFSLKKEMEQVKEASLRNRMMIDAETAKLREEINSVNEEGKQLHELVVFLGNQFNEKASRNYSTSINDSSIDLERLMNSGGGSKTYHKPISNQYTKSMCDRIQFLEDHYAEQRLTIKELV